MNTDTGNILRRERHLRIAVYSLIVAVAVLMIGLVFVTVRRQVKGVAPDPYEIRVPGVVAEGEPGAKIASNGRVRLITERCNTTDAPVVLDITTSWLRVDGDVTVVPGSPLAGVVVAPGGSLCDPPTGDPIVSGIEFPPGITEGEWQYQSQIIVSACNEYTEDPETPTRFLCHEVGPVLHQVGWFSEPFTVEG